MKSLSTQRQHMFSSKVEIIYLVYRTVYVYLTMLCLLILYRKLYNFAGTHAWHGKDYQDRYYERDRKIVSLTQDLSIGRRVNVILDKSFTAPIHLLPILFL